MAYQQYRKSNQKLEYKGFRVRTPVKTFRDLEVYKKTTDLAAKIFQIKLNKKDKNLEEELKFLKNIAKQIPKLIAESYGNKFISLDLALNKLEMSMQLSVNIMAKIDFLMNLIDNAQTRQDLRSVSRQYQIQKVKIHNLKKAWERVFGK